MGPPLVVLLVGCSLLYGVIQNFRGVHAASGSWRCWVQGLRELPYRDVEPLPEERTQADKD